MTPIQTLISARLLAVLAAAVALLTATAQASAPALAPSQRLIIGLLLPPEEAQAQSLREGVLLAADRGQATAVIRGRAGQWGADGVEAAAMISEDGALGLISPPGGAGSHLVLQVAGRTAVPVISLCADSSVSQTGVPWMTRVVPSTIDEGRILLAHAPLRRPSATNCWAAVVPNGRAGRESTKDLRTAAKETGCFLGQIVMLPDSTATQTAVPQQLLADGTTSVLIWLDPIPAGLMAKALRTAGFKGTLAGPSSLQCEAFMTAGGEALPGFLIPAIAREPESEALFKGFTTSYLSRFGHEPGSMALYSYDAATLLIELLRRFGDESLRHGAPPDFELPGVSGVMRFDARGNRKMILRLLTAHQGHFVPLLNRHE